MKTIYLTKVRISLANAGITIDKVLKFPTAEEAEKFHESIKPSLTVKALPYGVEHILSAEEALAEIIKTMEPA